MSHSLAVLLGSPLTYKATLGHDSSTRFLNFFMFAQFLADLSATLLRLLPKTVQDRVPREGLVQLKSSRSDQSLCHGCRHPCLVDSTQVQPTCKDWKVSVKGSRRTR